MKVTFEVAKLAKERGFKPEREWNPAYTDGYIEEGEEIEDTQFKEEDYGCDGFYLAPQQHNLQKWLREAHGIHVQPQKTFHNKTYLIGKILVECRLKGAEHQWAYGHPNSYNKPKSTKFNTYEEALERGLYEALKLL